MSILKQIKIDLTTQILELEALQSVYPKELSISDYGNLSDINNFIAGNQNRIPQRLEYIIEILSSKDSFELHVNLPLNYPNVNPEIYCRSSILNRNKRMNLNKDLLSFNVSQEKGEPIIYSLISWIQDNAETYLKSSSVNENKKKSKNINNNICANFVRFGFTVTIYIIKLKEKILWI